MYVGCNGETCVYMSCLTVARVYGKKLYFLLWSEQKGEFKSAEGNGRPSKQDAWSVEKFSITDAP
jgi:hypothetical protein